MIETLNQDERKFYDLCRVEKPNMKAVIAIGKILGATIKETGAGLPSRRTLPERLETIFKEARKNIASLKAEPEEDTIDAKEAVKRFRAGDQRINVSIELTCSLTEFVKHFKTA